MVLDHEDGQVVLIADLHDEVGQLLRLLRVHTGCRLIEEQQLRLRRECACDLEAALESVRKARRDIILVLIEALLPEKLLGLCPHALLFLPVQAQRRAEDIVLRTEMPGDQYVIEDRQIREETDVLEGPGDAELRDGIRSVATKIAAAELYGAGGRGIDAGDAVERGRLTGTVRADQGDDLAAVDLKREAIDRAYAAELHDDVLHLEDIFFHLIHTFPLAFFTFFLPSPRKKPRIPFQLNSLVPMRPRE